MTRHRSKKLVYLLLSWPPHTIGYVIAPLAVSQMSRHHGWANGRPSTYNLSGSVLVAGGAGLIVWAIVSHYRESPDRVEATVIPDYLVTSGAYGKTRNPLYLGGATMWVGWAILLGSLAVTVAGPVLFSALAAVGIPFEERLLTRKFGSRYAAYRHEVPRWLNLRGPHG